MLGFSIGPLVGGTLTHFTGWGVVFWSNVPLMLTAIAGLACAGSATGHGPTSKSQRADWIGFVLLTTLMVSLVFGLHELPHARAAPLPVIGPFLLAGAAFFLRLRVGARAGPPLVGLTFFSGRRLLMGLPTRSLAEILILSPLLLFTPLSPILS